MTLLYSAGIVGAGRIAARYDTPSDQNVLTHAHSLSTSARVRCLGFYDTDETRTRHAADKWGCAAFDSLQALMFQRPDIVIVCVPDEHHHRVLHTLLEYSPRLVLCEKPLTSTYSDSLSVIEAYRRRGISLSVNYQRRYDPDVCDLKQEFVKGQLGKFVGGAVIYSKGVLHNGSHGVDLLRYLFGEARGFVATERVHDCRAQDPTVSATLFFESGPIQLIAADERHYSLFEVDLFFGNGRYRFIHSGFELERYEVREDPLFAGHRELRLVNTKTTGLSKALTLLTEDLVCHLDGRAELRTAAAEALPTQLLCEKLVTCPLNTYVSLETS